MVGSIKVCCAHQQVYLALLGVRGESLNRGLAVASGVLNWLHSRDSKLHTPADSAGPLQAVALAAQVGLHLSWLAGWRAN